MTSEPTWVSRAVVEVTHRNQLRAHGGRWGIRDENLLESALSRPQQRWSYEPEADIFDLGAAYAYGIARNHPFVDGNKRTAFTTMGIFLYVNGHRLTAPEADAVITMLGVAAGDKTEADLAAWCRSHSEPRE